MIAVLKRLAGAASPENRDYRLLQADLSDHRVIAVRLAAQGEPTLAALRQAVGNDPQRRALEAFAEAREEYFRSAAEELGKLREAGEKLKTLRSQSKMAKARVNSLNSDVADAIKRLSNPESLAPQLRQAEERLADLTREIGWQEEIVKRATVGIEEGLRRAIEERLKRLQEEADRSLRASEVGVAAAIAEAVLPIFAARNFHTHVQGLLNYRQQLDPFVKLSESDLK